MSDDWLVTSDRSVQVAELLLALEPWGQAVTLRAAADESCTVVADVDGSALVWITPSAPVRDVAHIVRQHRLPDLNSGHAWWTEVIAPSGPDHPTVSGVTSAAVAASIARCAGGVALPLGALPGSPRDTRPTQQGHAEELACDVLTDEVAIFLQSRPVLALTAWATLAMMWAQGRGRVPVFLTPSTTRLSPVLHHFAERGGCWWIRETPGGLTSGVTGTPVRWDGTSFRFTGDGAPTSCGTGTWELLLECETHHPTSSEAPVGQLAYAAHLACGIAPPTSWGMCEPTDRPWQRHEIAHEAAKASPEPFRFFSRSGGADGIAAVLPEPVGLREEVVMCAPAGDLMPVHTDLVRIGERLLQAGADWAAMGYRYAPSATDGAGGPASEPLPGLICYRPGRFGGFDPATLDIANTPGVVIVHTDSGVVITFRSGDQPTDDEATAALSAWRRTLGALASSDVLRSRRAAPSPQHTEPISVEA
ncbi:hypothetical protein BH23ACT6_BH23ACT6_11050 [soil metagenome]